MPFNEEALFNYKENKKVLTVGVLKDGKGNIGLPNLPTSDAAKRSVEIVIG